MNHGGGCTIPAKRTSGTIVCRRVGEHNDMGVYTLQFHTPPVCYVSLVHFLCNGLLSCGHHLFPFTSRVRGRRLVGRGHYSSKMDLRDYGQWIGEGHYIGTINPRDSRAWIGKRALLCSKK